MKKENQPVLFIVWYFYQVLFLRIKHFCFVADCNDKPSKSFGAIPRCVFCCKKNLTLLLLGTSLTQIIACQTHLNRNTPHSIQPQAESDLFPSLWCTSAFSFRTFVLSLEEWSLFFSLFLFRDKLPPPPLQLCSFLSLFLQ